MQKCITNHFISRLVILNNHHHHHHYHHYYYLLLSWAQYLIYAVFSSLCVGMVRSVVNLRTAKKFTLFPFKSAADGRGKFEDRKEPWKIMSKQYSVNVWFQKISIPFPRCLFLSYVPLLTPRRVTGNFKGEWVSRGKTFRRKYEWKLEFLEGWGWEDRGVGLKPKKSLGMEGVWVIPGTAQ